MSIKFLLLGGGEGILGFGGGECQFYFYGREDFSEKWNLGSPASLFREVAVFKEGPKD